MVRWSGKFRIYPTDDQKAFFAKHFGGVRFIYNYFLSRSNEIYTKEKGAVSIYDLKEEIPLLKATSENSWLKELNSQSLQEAVLNLGKARQKFFDRQGGRPQFKHKHGKQVFTMPQNFLIETSKKGNAFLCIPKLKTRIKIRVHREVVGKMKRLTITKTRTGKYFASVMCEVEQESLPKPKTWKLPKGEIGIDLGLSTFVTKDNGDKTYYPKFLKLLLKRLTAVNKAFSKKKKGSKNQEKARVELALIYEKIANQRKAFIHETSFALVNENQVIYAEDLYVKGMMQNRCLSRAFADTAMGELIRQIKYKTRWRGRVFKQIGRFEPSSKMCNVCKTINKELTLGQRIWKCKVCYIMHDQDVNAAINILQIGQAMSLGKDVPEVKPVERSTKVFSKKKKQVGSVKQEPASNTAIRMHGNLLP